MTLARLPHAEHAFVDPRKIVEYLLSETHPIGRYKAAVFRSFGFRPSRPEELIRELERIALQNGAEMAEENVHGQKYRVRGRIVGPAGKSLRILSVWIILHDDRLPRLVTAYPEDTR